jgi:hypothetical protein
MLENVAMEKMTLTIPSFARRSRSLCVYSVFFVVVFISLEAKSCVFIAIEVVDAFILGGS